MNPMATADRTANALVATDLAEARGDVSHLSATQVSMLDRARIRLAEGDATATHLVSLILDRRVRMPLYRWDAATKSFASLARKAAARGLPVPTIEEVERETVGEGEHAETWITARILGAAPVLDGWRCVATLTHISSTDLVMQALATGAEVVFGQLLTLVGKIVEAGEQPDTWIVEHAPSSQRMEVTTAELVAHNSNFDERVVLHVADGESFEGDDATMRCDHCGHNRRRHLVFALRHDDGRELLVGSTCLNDYLGTDALGAWFVWSRLHEVTERFAGWSTWDIAEHAQWFADNPEVITRKASAPEVPLPLVDFVAACIAEVRVHGYVSRGQIWRDRGTDDGPTEATGSKVWRTMQDATHVAPVDGDFARAEEIVEWIDTLDRDDFDLRTGELRYTSSLARSLDASKRTGVHQGDACMLASAVGAYERELARRAADAGWTDAHVPGSEGDAVVLDLVVRRSLGWALACADEAGRQIVVKASSYKTDGVGIEIGDAIRVSASLGRLGSYRGVKQTMLSRPAVYRRTEALTPAHRKKAAAMFERLGEAVPEWAQPKKRARKK